MRSSRLLALVLRVQRTGRTTAAELAAELGVSVRTVYRDVRALQDAGVPLWTAPGPHGGIHLVEGWRSPVDGMTTDEAGALLLGGAAADLGLGNLLATARSKVRSAVPESLRDHLDLLSARFHLDTRRWLRGEPPEHLATVAAAVWQGRRLDLRYDAGRGGVVRVVDPLGLVLKAGTWYLVAAVGEQLRTYRVSRVVAASPQAEPASRPAGFDLAAYWATADDDVDAAIRTLATTVRLPVASTTALRHAVPGRLTVTALADAVAVGRGRLRVELPMEPVPVAVVQLATVPGVEVLRPDHLRRALASHAGVLAALNADPDPGPGPDTDRGARSVTASGS